MLFNASVSMYPFKQELLYFATGLCNMHDRRMVFYALLFYVFTVCCFQF